MVPVTAVALRFHDIFFRRLTIGKRHNPKPPSLLRRQESILIFVK